jgi:cytochrome c oxidase subunit 2
MMKPHRSALKKFSFIILSLFFLQQTWAATPAPAAAAGGGDKVKGKEVFTTTCSSCHKLGEILIGPDLIGVKSRWPDQNKLKAFVHNPSAFLGKDPYLIKLQAKMGGATMSVPPLTDEQVENVLAYVNEPGGPTPQGGPGESYSPVPKDMSLLKYIFFGIIVLLIVILYLSMRIRDAFASAEDETKSNDRHKKRLARLQKINSYLMLPFLALFLGGIFYEASVDMKFMRPEAATDIGKDIDRLFNNTLIITAIVFFVTQILLFWYAFRYRHSDKRKAYFYSHNNTIEFIWTAIPAVVLAYLVLDGFRTWRNATNNPDNHPITIEAFARQFDWTFRYAGPDGKLGKVDFRLISGDNPLGIDYTDPASHDDYVTSEGIHMPVGHDIYIKLRSQDVIHAAYFPHFRMQMYAQPGMDNRLRFKPTITTAAMRKKIGRPNFVYELACNQLCGAGHWNMRRVVTVETDAEFAAWEKTHKPSYDPSKPIPANPTAMK